jgi:tight adherence protein B
MGALVGLLFGSGMALMWWALASPRVTRDPGAVPRDRVREMLAQAGVESVTPASLFASCAGTGLVAFLTVASLSRSVVIGLFFGAMAGYLPVALVRYRHRRRRVELRQLWPDVVDNLASAVRAGMSLPEALSQLSVRGPEELRRPFQRFAEDYRATGRFVECLDRLKASLADPVGDRIVESLRMAREVGGSDLGRLLRTLSSFLREDARTRAELETRQGWTVNGARLAVASPWMVLALLSVNPESAAAYNTPAGFLVLLGGAVVCLASYRVMLRIGRLPDEERVLR